MNFVRTFLFSLGIITVLSFATPANGQTSQNQKKYVIDALKIDDDIKLTGTLSDPHWKIAPTVQCTFEIQPGENTPAKQKTWVKTLYNSRYIYFGFICEDTHPSEIRAHVTDRDNNFEDDFVFVGIDTYEDNQRGYEFAVNPFGIQSDLLRTQNNEDPSWDAVWYSKAAINSKGYIVEIAIPFQSLHFPSAETQNWSVMFVRNYPRDSRYQNSWTPVDRNDPCIICQSGTLKGLKGLQATGSIEVLPYAMGFQAGNLNDADDPNSGFVNGKVNGRVGGGIKYVPNPSLSVEAVVNPDFSQVESDATQVSVNTTFAIFYPEKRPFFLNGADQFTTQVTDFYSRMINNPLAAAKLIEKSQHLTIAYLSAEDRNSPFIVPGEEGSSFVESSLKSFSNILRAKYDFGTQSFIGVLGTARNFSNPREWKTSAHNYTGGIDWNLLFGGNYTFLGQALLSDTKEIADTSLFSDNGFFGNTRFTKTFDGETYGGTGVYAQFRRDARKYSFQLKYQDLSPTFQAQSGFITGNNFRLISFSNSYAFYPVNELIDNGNVFADGNVQFNYDNVRKDRWATVGLFLQMKSQTSVTIQYLPYNEELFHGVRFSGINRGEVQINSSPTSSVQISADAQIGRFIYRADNPSLGTGHVLSLNLTLKPASKLELDLSYARSRLSDFFSDTLFYDGYIARCTGIYQFTNDIFVRLITQYDKFNKVIEADPLFSYKLNPFTIFYAGSTHSLTDFGSQFGIRQTARQFFIKLQYLWRE